MKKISLLVVPLLFCTVSSAQMKNALEKFETVYKDENVTFRKLDDNTWAGSGNVMSSETMYLLSGKNRAVLIDAGTNIPGLKDIATGIAGKPVTLVLTHVHPDHAGAAGCFDEVWINPGDTVNVPAFMNDYKGKILYLKNGQKLKLGGRELEAYFTPGHTPGSVTFLEKGTDRGFCGDAFGTGRGGSTGGILVFTDMETVISTCRASYDYFEKKGYRRLYCGHFYGENLMTLDRIKCIESVASDIQNGKVEGTPYSGVYGLNMKASRDDFSVRFVNRSSTPVEKDMSVQLYSLRTLIGTPELFEKNHDTTLKQVRQMGFTGVEAASYDAGKFSGLRPEEFRKTVESYGLTITSSHTNRHLTREELESGDISNALDWWKTCIADHKAAGIPVLVMASESFKSTKHDLQVMADYLNAIGRMCKDAGIQFGYHNHHAEFRQVEDTTMMDYLLANTDPEYVFFELDVWWAVYAGVSPVDYMKKYPGRYAILHIKDRNEIGQSGMVGFDAIFSAFNAAGTRSYIVELEQASTPDILLGLRQSAEYLLKASFVK